MRHETVAQMFKQYHNRKKNGVKHEPLHTLKECCEEVGITPSWFGRLAAQHPDAPQPVFKSHKNVGRGPVSYYRKREVVQWVEQFRQQQATTKGETKMPDIKTALQEALSKTATAWAADDEAHKKIEPQPQQEKAMTTVINDGRIVNNVSRTVFNFIHGNPGIKRQDARTRLVAQGFKDSSVTSLISQMVRTDMVRVDETDSLFTMRQEYAPVQNKKNKQKRLEKRKVITIVRKPRTEPVVEPAPVIVPSFATPKDWTVDSVIGGLNVRQAMAVYHELRNIFGE